MPTLNINVQDCIIPMYDTVLEDVLGHKHTHYVFPGGRGSCKSSFVGIVIPLVLMTNPLVHAACFRKIGNTIQNSIRAQIEWGIYKLGVQDLFLIPKSYANPIVFKPTGQCIHFLGLDKPAKIKYFTERFIKRGCCGYVKLSVPLEKMKRNV